MGINVPADWISSYLPRLSKTPPKSSKKEEMFQENHEKNRILHRFASVAINSPQNSNFSQEKARKNPSNPPFGNLLSYCFDSLKETNFDSSPKKNPIFLYCKFPLRHETKTPQIRERLSTKMQEKLEEITQKKKKNCSFSIFLLTLDYCNQYFSSSLCKFPEGGGREGGRRRIVAPPPKRRKDRDKYGRKNPTAQYFPFALGLFRHPSPSSPKKKKKIQIKMILYIYI